jgi:hypothetical protein
MASLEDIVPARDAVAVTKSDATTYSPPFRALWVGGAGDVAVKTKVGGSAVTFVGVAAGTILPVNAYQVMSTNTTATSIVGIY